MKKVGSLLLFSNLFLDLWSLNSQKLYPFCSFFFDISQKSRAVQAIYVYASESSLFTFLENGVHYYDMI